MAREGREGGRCVDCAESIGKILQTSLQIKMTMNTFVVFWTYYTHLEVPFVYTIHHTLFPYNSY